MAKKLNKETWTRLCEAEEIIVFLTDRIPEAHSLRRINAGVNKGYYEVTVDKDEDWHEYYFRGMLGTVAEEWLNGDLSWRYEYDKDCYGRDIENSCRAVLLFSFNAYLTNKYQKEFEVCSRLRAKN